MPEWIVPEEAAGMRLDLHVAGRMAATRSEVQRWLALGTISLNDSPARPGLRLRAGDRIAAAKPQTGPAAAVAESLSLDVVFEDEHLLVINKPRGMVVHPSHGHSSGTLVNAVLGHADDLSGVGGEERPGIVHRLDKDTSGLIIVAKTDEAHRALQAQIQAHTAERRYLAIVWGSPSFGRAEVDAPIGRHPVDRKKMAVVHSSRGAAREAITDLEVRERLGPFSLLEASLRTGRTHQIRVHCAYIGHPVAGDPIYGGLRKVPGGAAGAKARAAIQAAMEELGGQLLHAERLSFAHPSTGEKLSFESPPPEVFQRFLNLLRSNFGPQSG